MKRALLACIVCACGRAEAPAPAPAQGSAPTNIVELTEAGVVNAQVKTAKVSKSAFSPRLTVAATLDPDPGHIAHIGSRASGRIAKLDVLLGDTVKKGQPLFEIDTVEVHETSSAYLTAIARARQADDALQRQKQLVTERVGAVQDLRRAEADAEAASATLREAKEHLHFLGMSAASIAAVRTGNAAGNDHSVLRAPIDGRVAAIEGVLGQVLTGTEDVVTIIDANELWATLRIYERDVAGVRPGAVVELKVPAYPDLAFPGTVERVGEMIDPKSRSLEARVKVVNDKGQLKAGMSATATIVLPAQDAALWLPATAVQARGVERIVFVQVAPRRFEARSVAAGAERSGYVPVTSGLAEGADVVIAGTLALRGELERAELGD